MDKKTVKNNSSTENIARLDRLTMKGERYSVVLTTNINTENLDNFDIACAFMEFQEDVFAHFFFDQSGRIIHIDDLAEIKKRSLSHIERLKEEHKNDDSEWVSQQIEYVERGFDYIHSLANVVLGSCAYA